VPPGWTPTKRSVDEKQESDYLENSEIVETQTDIGLSNNNTAHLDKRIKTAQQVAWAPSQLSVPPRKDWTNPDNEYTDPQSRTYTYYRDASECAGQHVYLIEDDFDVDHAVG
jgi:hypothetical protein